jgi:hypothetical protein
MGYLQTIRNRGIRNNGLTALPGSLEMLVCAANGDLSTQAIPSGGIGGATGAVDNAVLRADGAGGTTAQAGTIAILTDAGSFSTTAGNAQYTSASGDVQIGVNTFVQPSQGRFITAATISHWSFWSDICINRDSITLLSVRAPFSTNFLDFKARDFVATRSLTTASFTVATLPTAGTAGRIAYASNGRKSGEGAGAGTGVPVWDDGSNWKAFYDNTTVAA